MMRIAVGMSGGIDSSVTALLLKRQGHDVVGLTAGTFRDDMTYRSPFMSPSNLDDIRVIADMLEIELHMVPVTRDFNSLIIEPFCDEYLRGRTPNPCVLCNPLMKFSTLMDMAMRLNCDMLATGHYAGIGRNDKRSWVTAAADPVKDQSYFLYRLPQEMLRGIIFPLGEMTKKRIREIAAEAKLPVADRPDSQEICFIPDNRYIPFVDGRAGGRSRPGQIIDSTGRVLGSHQGIHRYTIGQRRGLGIAADRPLYVTGLDPATGTVFAGYRDELAVAGMIVTDIVHMKEETVAGDDLLVKIRSTHKPVAVHATEHDGIIRAMFENPEEGVSPGQSAVFYDKTGAIIGGGFIDRSIPRHG